MYQGRPRLGFAAELLKVTDQIASEMESVTIPFLIIHGEDDEVTGEQLSALLLDVDCIQMNGKRKLPFRFR